MEVQTFTNNEGQSEKQIKYSNDDITVIWKPGACKHSGRCVTQLPGVFDTHKHPWVDIKGATSGQIIEQVNKCPTGALSIGIKS